MVISLDRRCNDQEDRSGSGLIIRRDNFFSQLGYIQLNLHTTTNAFPCNLLNARECYAPCAVSYTSANPGYGVS